MKSLKDVHNVDVNHYYVAIALKNPDSLLLERASRSIASNGQTSQVVGQHPLRVLRAFVKQNPLEILKKGDSTRFVVPLSVEVCEKVLFHKLVSRRVQRHSIVGPVLELGAWAPSLVKC